MKRAFSFVILLIAFQLSFVGAQTVVKVASRTFEEAIEYRTGDTLSLETEKARVEIVGWDKNLVAIQIQFISKHKEEEVAIRELAYLHHQLDKSDGIIYLANYFRAEGQFKAVKGMLSANITIKAPNRCPIKVVNKFGSTDIKAIDAPIAVSGRFVDTYITNCASNVQLSSFFGSNLMQSLQGDVSFELVRTNLEIDDFSGSIDGSAELGTITIRNARPRQVDVQGNRTEIELGLLDDLDFYNYDLNTTFSQIVLTDGFETSRQRNSWEKVFGDQLAQINITTTYKPITITYEQREQAKN